MSQNLLEKLELRDEKNVLIQGLPSSIEKQFAKISFSKNVTPLLKSRKIDFALVFALNGTQLKGIMRDVLPALHQQARFWIAIPKSSSKIVTDLHKECSFSCVCDAGFEGGEELNLDHVWTAIRYTKKQALKAQPKAKAAVEMA
ncbi:MAG: hypothetical protein K2P88_05280 [Chitinophagaceae bacterium]|jgi:hypothetical protein|uniref:hypothetical protein n=1 Tax=unclassified Paraflavitalea TaxID=2798305 RepID=UPI003D34C035|nr:hypothetical protein [Chitinophagaceae bacterium]